MNLPVEFSSQIKALLKNDYKTFFEALEKEVPVSIRVNPAKNEKSPAYEAVKWNRNGYYLPERPPFTFDPLFHAGCYYPQEASSMFIAQVIGQFITSDIRILDLCAAPGGKSTLLASMMGKNSLLVANEVIRNRAHILSENICKWGNPNVIVTNNDPAEIGKLTHYFDLILVDAPCSGEGMFRKDAKAIDEWSLPNVKLCAERQRRILYDVWDSLTPGGLLIYSTCTYNTHENEENVEWIVSELGAEIMPLDIPSDWNISGGIGRNIPVYRFFPHKIKGEGFFMAILRKKGEKDSSFKRVTKKSSKRTPNKPLNIPDYQRNYLSATDEFGYYNRNNTLYAFPKTLAEDLDYLKKLSVISAGITLGEQKGKDFVPAHSLAMSNYLNRSAFVIHDVDRKTAIGYLQKEAITMPASLAKGYILLTYKNTPIGFVKNIGNRANNLYPMEWRIRSGNIPDKDVNVLMR